MYLAWPCARMLVYLYTHMFLVNRRIKEYMESLKELYKIGVGPSSSHTMGPMRAALRIKESGINVGKDMMGTMSNTLILAFTGGAVNTMILIYAYIMPYMQVVNMYSIGIEVIKGISGTLGIVLTVPLVSLISAKVYGK